MLSEARRRVKGSPANLKEANLKAANLYDAELVEADRHLLRLQRSGLRRQWCGLKIINKVTVTLNEIGKW